MKIFKSPLKILHLEDMSSDAELVERILKKGQIECEILVVANRADYIRESRKFKPDIILSDHTLPAFNSLEALEILKYSGIQIPFILVTATVSEEFAVKAMKEGIDDYILKDRPQRLPETIHGVLEKYRIERERQKAMKEVIAKEALMKKAEALAHLGSWDIDMIEGTTKWSDEAFRIYGYMPGEIEPNLEILLGHIHPEDLASERKALEEAVKSGDSHKSEFRIIDKNGEVKYLRAELIIERNTARKPIRLTGFNLDITAQKR